LPRLHGFSKRHCIAVLSCRGSEPCLRAVTRKPGSNQFRREITMTQLDFCREHDEQAIAHAHADESTPIPGVGDRVLVPDEQQSSVSVHVKVEDRRFHYDQEGHLAMVRLSCRVLSDGEELFSDLPGTLSQGDSPVNTVLEVYHPGDGVSTFVPACCCPRCECLLTLHQPDPQLPDCFLATCDDCTSWYLTNPSGTALCPIRRPKDWLSRN
jgi:hypothetical protein